MAGAAPSAELTTDDDRQSASDQRGEFHPHLSRGQSTFELVRELEQQLAILLDRSGATETHETTPRTLSQFVRRLHQRGVIGDDERDLAVRAVAARNRIVHSTPTALDLQALQEAVDHFARRQPSQEPA
jgi:hypothetical protein